MRVDLEECSMCCILRHGPHVKEMEVRQREICHVFQSTCLALNADVFCSLLTYAQLPEIRRWQPLRAWKKNVPQ